MNHPSTELDPASLLGRAELLRDVPFFSQLDQRERQNLARLLNTKTFHSGDSIFLVGEPGDSLFIVKRGRVEIFLRDNTGQKIPLTLVEARGMFGELSVLDRGPRSASACALEECELLMLDHEHLETFLQASPHALSGMLQVLGERLRHADSLLRGQSVVNPNQAIENKLSLLQRWATMVADFSGSIVFLVSNVAFFVAWIVLNCGLLPGVDAFDPYPFGFLTMFVSLEAIMLSILVLLSQNLQSAREKVRNDIEYDVNVRAELEVTHLHTKVDLLHAELLARLHQIEKKLSGR